MKKITLSKMDLVNEDSLQTLIDNNGLQSIVGGISNIATSDEAARQDSAYYRAIIIKR
jgi:hypothetical protein